MSDERRGFSLRATVSAVTVAVTVLALLASGGLVVLTTALWHATASMGASVESVRLAEEAEIDLLLHARANDPLLRRDIEAELLRRLEAAGRFVTNAEEARTLAVANRAVATYLATGGGDGAPAAGAHDAAYAALERLVEINVGQAEAAQRDAARWDVVGDVLGIGVGIALIALATALILWLRRRAFAPVLALADAMARFGRGERDARAPERGPRELREMCARFNEMATAAAAQREAQIAFLGGVAHDLRNPLAALQMATLLLDPDEPLPPEPVIRQTIARVGRQIARMDRMLGDFLDVARIDAGQLELRVEAHDARALVAEVGALFEGSSPRHRLEIELPDHACPLRCDSLRIEQVVTNLVSNAIKYSPAGGPIAVRVAERGDELTIAVVDRGMGMTEEDRARIFEPFRRVGLGKEGIPGVGLGLFVVRRILEAHGGRIEVESRHGLGSTFRAVLPSGRPRFDGARPPGGAGGAAPTPTTRPASA